METAALVQSICELARDFYARGDVSMVTLLERIGLLDGGTAASEESLCAYLQKNPELIDSWAILSDDNRTQEAWYLKAPHAGQPSVQWAVGRAAAQL